MSVNRYNNSDGFTLVEVLVIGALAGFLALGGMSVVSNMLNTYKRMQSYQSLETTHLDIMTLLVNRGACVGTFAPLGNLNSLPTVNQIVDAGGLPRYVVGSTYDREFVITGMQVTEFTGPASYPGTTNFSFVINYRFVSPAVKPQEVSRKISMSGLVASGNIIQSCWSSKAGDYDHLYINTSGPPETKDGNLTILGRLQVLRDGTAGGNIITEEYFQTSDRRFKTDIKTLKNALGVIEKFRGVEFVWKDKGTKDWGFIAQEVEKVAPFLVNTDSETDYKSVNYNALIALSVQAIKELELKNQKNNLEFQKLKKDTTTILNTVCRDHPEYDFCKNWGG